MEWGEGMLMCVAGSGGRGVGLEYREMMDDRCIVWGVAWSMGEGVSVDNGL